MATATDFRNWVKAALAIAGSSAERGFDDISLDRHVQEAVREFSLHVPVRTKADVVVTGGTRVVSLSLLTRPIRVEAVEYPLDRYPEQWLEFAAYGGELRLGHGPPAASYTVRVYFAQAHLVDGSGSTVEPEHEGAIVEGAAALALLARMAGAANTFETAANQAQTYQHLRLAQERLRRWRTHLRLLSGGVGLRQMYVSATGQIARVIVD